MGNNTVPLTEEQMWKTGKNTEPEEHQKFKQRTLTLEPLIEVVDLFCGGGGFSTGAIHAGAKVVLAIDNWKPALLVHHANHPDVKTIQLELGGSIEETAILIREHLSVGSHFHLHASPPCQALSNASKHKAEDGLGLVSWFIRLVEYMNPDSWSMENVVPLGKHLDRLHPNVKWVKLNSADFGVPQTRTRILAGDGWEAKPTHAKDEWVSVIEALPKLAEELNGDDRLVQPCVRKIGVLKKNGRILQPMWREMNEQSYTITSTTNSIATLPQDVGRENPQVPVKIRSMTLEETAILQGFPETYLFPYEKKKDAWVIVGNAVCPPVAEAIIKGLSV